MKTNYRKRIFLTTKEKIITSILLILIILLGIVLLCNSFYVQTSDKPVGVEFDTNYTSRQVYDYFSRLADKKGAEFAFEVLKKSSIKGRIDEHTLGHLIGFKLYEQKGLNGILVCTPEFTYACFHGVIIKAFAEEGESIVQSLDSICNKDPQTSDVYMMCYHGYGHGSVAYSEYNLDRAVEFCKKTKLSKYADLAYKSCIAGAVMEEYLGLHDKDVWKNQFKNYFKEEDPLSPCNTPLIENAVKPTCYGQLTLHFLQLAGLNQEAPDPKPAIFKKAFSYCDPISEDDTQSREKCYGSFGEMFVGLAKKSEKLSTLPAKSDFRQQVYEWCLFSTDRQGQKACIKNAVFTFYFMKEPKSDAYTFCNVIPSAEDKDFCFLTLSGYIQENMKIEKNLLRKECQMLPQNYSKTCLKSIQ